MHEKQSYFFMIKSLELFNEGNNLLESSIKKVNGYINWTQN